MGTTATFYSNEDALAIWIRTCQWEVAINLDICDYIHLQWPSLYTEYILKGLKCRGMEGGDQERPSPSSIYYSWYV